jgi:hypothetical protein
LGHFHTAIPKKKKIGCITCTTELYIDKEFYHLQGPSIIHNIQVGRDFRDHQPQFHHVLDEKAKTQGKEAACLWPQS